MKEDIEYLSAILVELRLLNAHLGASRQPAPAPAPAPDPVSICDLRMVFRVGVECGKKEELAGLLKDFGVYKLPDLKKKDYTRVYERALVIAGLIEGKTDGVIAELIEGKTDGVIAGRIEGKTDEVPF